jgi:hypothetical protein
MQTLDAERENYVATYLRGIAEAKAEHELAVPEVKIELSGEKLPKPYRYWTVDIMSRDGDKAGPIEVNLKAAKSFSPIEENWQGLQVRLHPFVWNGLEFKFDGDLSNDSSLIEWMKKWMDIEDTKPKDNNLLSQIVHNVSPPEQIQSGWSFSVDFGTAPIDSFVELIEVIRAAGAKKLELGSFGYRIG